MRTIFTFEITNRKKRYYTLLANIFLLFVSGIYTFYRNMQYNDGKSASVLGCFIIPAVLFLVILLRFIFIIRRKDILFTQLHFSLIFTACWALEQQYVFAAIIGFLGIFEYLVNRDTVCIIDEQGICLKSVPARKYTWAQLQNVMIKEGIFTADRKDNHIFQVDVSREVLSFSEEQFNAFCTERLK